MKYQCVLHKVGVSANDWMEQFTDDETEFVEQMEDMFWKHPVIENRDSAPPHCTVSEVAYKRREWLVYCDWELPCISVWRMSKEG
jgi:hypothetical protein